MNFHANGKRSGLSLLIDRRIESMKSNAAIHPDNVVIDDAAPAGASVSRSGLSKRVDARIASMRQK